MLYLCVAQMRGCAGGSGGAVGVRVRVRMQQRTVQSCRELQRWQSNCIPAVANLNLISTALSLAWVAGSVAVTAGAASAGAASATASGSFLGGLAA